MDQPAAAPPAQQKDKLLGWLVGVPVATAILGTVTGWWVFQALLPKYTAGDWLGFWGLWAGALGLLTTLVGFILTFIQLRRTQTAAHAVAAAIIKVQREYGTFDIAREMRGVSSEIKIARQALELDRLVDAQGSYDNLRASLMKMSSARSVFTGARREELKDGAGRAQDAYRTLSEKLGAPEMPLPKQDMISQLQDLDSFMIMLEAEVKDEINGG